MTESHRESASLRRLRAAAEAKAAEAKAKTTSTFENAKSTPTVMDVQSGKVYPTEDFRATLAKLLKETKAKQKTVKVEVEILPQRRIWKSLDGRRTPICEMHDGHLVNALFMLKRGAMKRYLASLGRDAADAGHSFHPFRMHSGSTDAQIGTVVHEAMQALLEGACRPSAPEASTPDVAPNATWEDFTCEWFHPVKLECLRRGLVEAIELLKTDRMRLKD